MQKEMCIDFGWGDNMAQSMDEVIKKIACMITELDGLAYSTYKPIVEDICTRREPESEVEHILDYMVGMCNSDRMLELFERACRKYIHIKTCMKKLKWIELVYILHRLVIANE